MILSEIINAYQIARKSLNKRYMPLGIYAGETHFSDLWTRDCCFAGLGSLKCGDVEPVKRSLETLIAHMDESGLLPLRVGQKHFLLKYLFIDKLYKKKPQSRFKDDKTNTVPTDSNSLFAILFQAYIMQTNNKAFLKQHFGAFRKAIDWNLSQCNSEYFLSDEGYATWADSLNKTGHILYTNVLHCKALGAFVECANTLKKDQLASQYNVIYQKLKTLINHNFWTGEFYSDSRLGAEKPTFATEGNALAILFDIAPIDRAKKVVDYVSRVFKEDFCISLYYPKFEIQKVYRPFRYIHLSDYHNGLRWLWVGCIEAVAKLKAGFSDDAKASLNRLAKKINEYNGVYEVYESNGKPVKRLFYRSEKTFAWSSGLFIWACHECGLVN